MMIRSIALAVAVPSASLATLVAGQVPFAPVVTTTEQQLLRWSPGEMRCAGGIERAVAPPAPRVSLNWGAGELPRPVAYRFAIDASGRTTGIAREGASYAAYSDDLGPSLAVARFTSGTAREGCEVTFTATRTPIADAPVSDLIGYTMDAPTGSPPEAVWDRIRSAGSTCADRPLKVLLRAFPDFETIPATPGVRDWSMIGFDIDAKGRAVAIHAVADTGNAALTTASADAIKRSRFGAEARAGCLYPYWRRAGTIPVPALPDTAAYQKPSGGCPGGNDWVRKPVLRYPEPYRRRSVEGWAMVAFDVAPWGATGNIRVLASVPAADFGEMAKQIIGGARLPRSPGRVGCTERVRFVIDPRDRAGDPTGPEAPAPIY